MFLNNIDIKKIKVYDQIYIQRNTINMNFYIFDGKKLYLINVL